MSITDKEMTVFPFFNSSLLFIHQLKQGQTVHTIEVQKRQTVWHTESRQPDRQTSDRQTVGTDRQTSDRQTVGTDRQTADRQLEQTHRQHIAKSRQQTEKYGERQRGTIKI